MLVAKLMMNEAVARVISPSRTLGDLHFIAEIDSEDASCRLSQPYYGIAQFRDNKECSVA